MTAVLDKYRLLFQVRGQSSVEFVALNLADIGCQSFEAEASPILYGKSDISVPTYIFTKFKSDANI